MHCSFLRRRTPKEWRPLKTKQNKTKTKQTKNKNKKQEQQQQHWSDRGSPYKGFPLIVYIMENTPGFRNNDCLFIT